jgi:hypothetical protein
VRPSLTPWRCFSILSSEWFAICESCKLRIRLRRRCARPPCAAPHASARAASAPRRHAAGASSSAQSASAQSAQAGPAWAPGRATVAALGARAPALPRALQPLRRYTQPWLSPIASDCRI